MLTQEEHVEVHALRRRGWSYSAIARHLGISRNTVKAYLRDGRQPGAAPRGVLDRYPDRTGPTAEMVQRATDRTALLARPELLGIRYQWPATET